MPRGTIQTPLSPSPGGVREDLAPEVLPPGSLLASTSWLTRRGVGRPRPGYTKNFQVADAKRVIGIGIRGTRDQSSNIVVQTTDHSYSWDGTTVTDVTGAGYAVSTIDQPARMITFSQGGTDYLLLINQANTIREWNGAGSFAATAGSPPNGKDMCVAGSRVVVVYPAGTQYRVQWSGFKDRTSWASTDIVDLADTTGAVVACRAFGPNTFGIYKDDAVYLGTVQAAIQPFQFQFIARVPGPVSPAVLVDALGVHYWMAEDYAIYRFDGSSPKLVSAGLSRTVAQNFSQSNRSQAFGFPFFSQDEREVWFFYPTVGGAFSAISLNVITDTVNHHTFTNTLTAAMDWRMQGSLTIDGLDTVSSTIDGLDSFSSTIDGLDGQGGTTRSALIGDTTGNVYTFGPGTSDNGTDFAWSFTHGWQVPGTVQTKAYIDAVSSLWKLETSGRTVTVGVEASDKLTDTESESTSTFSTAADAQHLLTFPNLSGKFIRVKHSGTGYTSSLEYRGAILTSWPKGRV